MATTLKGQIIRDSRLGTSLLLSLGSRNGARWQAVLDPRILRDAVEQAEKGKVEVVLSIGDDGQVEVYLTPMRITGDMPPLKRWVWESEPRRRNATTVVG